MTDREKVIKSLKDSLANLGCGYMDGVGELYAVSGEDLQNAIALLKEHEAVTEYVIDEFQPTCKACGFRPFAGYIPTLEWMKERGFKFCPQCGKVVKWE